jgi:D-sedoheptulose 7-phosphate isomerase
MSTPVDAARTISDALLGASDALSALRASHATIDASARACDALVDALRRGGKLLIVGNGGSSCDAAHFAEELTGRFRNDRPALAAIACTDAGHITCTANDYGFDEVFARWTRALARPGDVLIVLSTSGNSRNILAALKAAKERGAVCVALLGKGGGEAAALADHAITVPGTTSDRIQELHMLLLHAWVEQIERALGHA